MRWEKKRSRGLSPVIATIILSAVVISVGGTIWSFAQGASTVIANNYVNETLTLMNEIIERFAVEHVANSSNGEFLYIWVYNYGDVDIIVDVYANATDGTTYTYNLSLYNPISSRDVQKITVSYEGAPLEHGDSIVIKVHSRRQNNAYYKYYVS